MKRYYRVMLGRGSSFAEECFAGGFIAAGFIFEVDLTGRLSDEWRDFNREFVPVYMQQRPEKSKIGAGLNCGALWTVCKGIQTGELVLCPDGNGSYRVGEVVGDYVYAPESGLPHHRPVRWLDLIIPRTAMSPSLQSSTRSSGTISEVTRFAAEIEQLIGVAVAPQIVVTGNEDIEDPVAFAMEKHLEDFLVKNWSGTVLANDFDIFADEGDVVGQQYRTEVGPIDILAMSKDKKRLLVVELKRGRASDVVVGQLLRYMGYVKDQLAEANQTVEGVIIALEEDKKLRYALSAVPNASFYRYQISFKLVKGGG